ncbi:hypothetical protein HGM15179_016079 [Zosterops borbonicus]|uniref:Uncharacterized protein n=1 Tax=Zosterops borbonicus TaxID=364589 RepID=A0A8K1LEK1_9PASS|nr:hypothetical protein HGM15179_016079 [Zosterops borbonicus]
MSETFYKQPNSRIALLSLHIPTVLEQGYHGAEETLVSQIDWIVGLCEFKHANPIAHLNAITVFGMQGWTTRPAVHLPFLLQWKWTHEILQSLIQKTDDSCPPHHVKEDYETLAVVTNKTDDSCPPHHVKEDYETLAVVTNDHHDFACFDRKVPKQCEASAINSPLAEVKHGLGLQGKQQPVQPVAKTTQGSPDVSQSQH